MAVDRSKGMVGSRSGLYTRNPNYVELLAPPTAAVQSAAHAESSAQSAAAALLEAPLMRGRLISLEGIDGAGKTSQIGPLTDFLHGQGFSVCVYREPGSTPLGEELRRILKGGPQRTALSELLLFAAARAELVETKVKSDLESGRFVVLDRFTDSTLAYQGALGALPDELLDAVCSIAAAGLRPDLTLWLDLPPDLAAQRSAYDPVRMQMAEVGELPVDAIEQRAAGYHQRVRDRYRAICAAEPQRVVQLNAAQPVAEVTKAMLAAVRQRIDGWRAEGTTPRM